MSPFVSLRSTRTADPDVGVAYGSKIVLAKRTQLRDEVTRIFHQSELRSLCVYM